MHIGKYFEKEEPLTVEFDHEIQNMTLILNDIMGEYIIYIMLDHYLPSNDAAESAAGWGGDKDCYYMNDEDFYQF